MDDVERAAVVAAAKRGLNYVHRVEGLLGGVEHAFERMLADGQRPTDTRKSYADHEVDASGARSRS